jgi:hypothetical protein
MIQIDINTTRIKITGMGQAIEGETPELIHVFSRRVRVREAAVKLAQLMADNKECMADPRAFAKAAHINHSYREPFIREFNALTRLRGDK